MTIVKYMRPGTQLNFLVLLITLLGTIYHVYKYRKLALSWTKFWPDFGLVLAADWCLITKAAYK